MISRMLWHGLWIVLGGLGLLQAACSNLADQGLQDLGACEDHGQVFQDGIQQERSCGEDGLGIQARLCQQGVWMPWGECSSPHDPDESTMCAHGSLDTQPCGQEGLQHRVCEAGEWGPWSSCTEIADNSVLQDVLALLGNALAEDLFNRYILVSMRTSETDLVQSSEYRWSDFLTAFREMAVRGIASETFFVGDNIQVALVNIAAFLAQAMHETIQYNACDENNWSVNLGVPDYPVSAACGQWGQDYQSYHCAEADRHMECPVDPTMMAMARTNASWYGAPAPLFCAPRSVTGEQTPRWNAVAGWCSPQEEPLVPDFMPTPTSSESPWIDTNLGNLDQTTCQAYPGQKAGLFTFAGCAEDGCWNSYKMDTAGGQLRNHVEGCCWWGRGVIQTTGVCNFGKLNYYLAGRQYALQADGSRTKNQMNPNAPYAHLDFCENPQIICNGASELKWIAGLFYWLNNVQGYPVDDVYQWNYKAVLSTDANTILADPKSAKAKALVDATSGVVNRGCPALTCPGSGSVHAADKRFHNFGKVMTVVRHLIDPAQFPLPDWPPAP